MVALQEPPKVKGHILSYSKLKIPMPQPKPSQAELETVKHGIAFRVSLLSKVLKPLNPERWLHATPVPDLAIL